MLCYGFLCVFFIIRYVCKLDYILGYNLKRRELKKIKIVYMYVKLFMYFIFLLYLVVF